MFADARTFADGRRLEADLCVIGAGAAGITLARELADGPLRVVVLESGGLTPDGRTQELAGGEQAGLPYTPLAATRLRYFGGTTNHWGAVCRPFEPWDFEGDEQAGTVGWPIALDDLQPYYPRAAAACGVAGLDVLAAPVSPRVFPRDLHDAFEPHVVERVPVARRRMGANAHDRLARARNVTICLHANVLEIDTDEAARRATAVRATTFARNAFTVAARAFVLATGGIENARLLLLSRGRRPAGLGNDHGLVGRYFLEHPRFTAAVVVPTDRRIRARMFEWRRVRRAVVQTYMRLTPELRRREGIGQVLVRLEPVFADQVDLERTAGVRSLRSLLESPLEAGALQDVGTLLQDVSTWQRATVPGAPIPVPRPELVRAAVADPRGFRQHLPQLVGNAPMFAWWKLGGFRPVTHMRVTTIVVPVPNADSRVTLGAERDALGQPRARLDWRLSAHDHRSVRRTMEIFGAELGRIGAGRLKLLLDRDERVWPEDMRGGFHHMGTTRMSADPRAGVVDARCRVHGMENLYVAGSSTFATAGSGTPTLALVALALRLADDLNRTLA